MPHLKKSFWWLFLFLQQLEADIRFHGEQVKSLNGTADKLNSENHFEKSKIAGLKKKINDR